MITDRFSDLITFIASCNGTGKQELATRVDKEEVTEDEAAIIFYYASLEKIQTQLDEIDCKIDAL